MKRLLMLLVAGAVLWACRFSPVRTCSTDADCGEGARCHEQERICVIPPPEVPAPTCAEPCADHAQCVETRCAPRYDRVVLVAPAADTALSSEVEMVAELRLSPYRDRNDPAALEYLVELAADGGVAGTGELSRTGEGRFEGSWLPAEEGRYLLRALYPDAGLTSAPVPILIDLTHPSFTVEVPQAPPRLVNGWIRGEDTDLAFSKAWRRDETVEVAVRSADEDVEPSSVELFVLGLDGGQAAGPVPVAPTPSGCPVAYCGTAAVDLSTPSFPAFRGELGLRVSGEDRAGNRAEADAGVRVTRWKWRVSTDAGIINGSPALGSRGTLYIGTVFTFEDGQLYAIDPSGQQRWKVRLGAVEGTVAVGRSDAGEDRVYAGVKNFNGAALYAVRADGGTLGFCPEVFQTETYGTIAIAYPNGLEQAVMVRSASEPGPLSLRPDATANRCTTIRTSSLEYFTRGAISTDGQNVYYGDGRDLLSFRWDSEVWSTRPGWPYSAQRQVYGPAITGTTLVAGTRASGGSGFVFSLPSSGGSMAWHYPPFTEPCPPTGFPSIGPGNLIAYGDMTGALVQITLGAAAPRATASLYGIPEGAPAWGSDGRLYVATSAGNVYAMGPGLVPEWEVTELGEIPSSVALDCARDPQGLKRPGPGVLYVVNQPGAVYAFVVDSRGIDVTAPWPTFQRDPRRTGNSTLPLSEFACP